MTTDNKTRALIEQLVSALEINRVLAKDENGNYTKDVTPKIITNALKAAKDFLNTKCYSIDDENFNHQDFEEFVRDNDLQVGDTYFEADAIPVKHSDFIDVGSMLENADERLFDDIGDVSDHNFTDVSDEEIRELETLVIQWAETHVRLNFWKVRNSVEKTYVG